MVRTHILFQFNDGELSFFVNAVEVEYRTHTVYSVSVIDALGHRTLSCADKTEMETTARSYLMVANKAIYVKYL